MPQKPSPQIRTWGTRFDTLPTSPPVSPPAQEATIPDENTLLMTNIIPQKKKEEKMPHDASVFVGSLPSTIDQAELTRLLSEHLSEHTEVKNIKVVRDSKGGVCAFVQCEDAASAASLIHTLHSNPPKYFLGRILRYEPARAFRTLLISYRAPVQYISTNANTHSPSEIHQSQCTQMVDLELPYAMRVWRPRNSKFISLLYNAEAVDAENHGNEQTFPSDNASLFLQPVVFDAETIHSLASYFGHLERFSPYQISEVTDGRENFGEGRNSYPAPHDAPRAPTMDTTCWEIKWDYRDDCVSALMTLRRVPHLTVTWAHQPVPFGTDQRSPHLGSQFPHNSVAYPLHVQDRLHPRRSPVHVDSTWSADSKASDVRSTIGNISDLSSAKVYNEEIKHPQRSSPSSQDILPFNIKNESSPTRVEWSEIDFPPLGDMRGGRRPENGVWREKKSQNPDIKGSPPLALAHLAISAAAESDSFVTSDGTPERATEGREGQELDIPPTPGLGKSPITPKTPGSQFPITPTSANTALQRLHFSKEHGYYNDLGAAERELDPTTLFVGGLETFGPGAWNEEKVANFFSRFGGLESVKVVRPLNSHAAFAFVKFDNVESPARAVFEEHNRIYEGRTMRVQLRDCNPPRGPWRQSRSRGRFHNPHLAGSHRRIPESFDGADDRPTSYSEADHHAPSSTKSEAFTSRLPTNEDFIDEESPVSNIDTNVPTVGPKAESSDSRSCDLPPGALDPSSIPAVVTPPSSSFGSSTSVPLSAPTVPYSTGGGFYAPTPWMHPYAQQMQYPMSYFAYPGYPIPGQQVPFQIPPSFTSSTVSEVNGQGGSVQTQWPGMYGSYMPYAIQPTRTPALDQPQSQNLNSRAPLIPTGFIQNEQGTLIAVYQPEALDQYLAGSHSAPSSQAPVQSVSSWAQYPPPQPNGFPFSGPPPTAIMPTRPTPPSITQVGWVPNQGYVSQPSQSTPLPNPSFGSGYRGGYNDMGRQPGPPSYRRHSNRRDQHGIYNNQGRNNQSRSFASRNSRGNMNNTGYPSNGDGHFRSPQSQFNRNSGEWSQWER
ncbi:hypothetical protein BDZ94DRAFT_947042 [Collybia nuda]|uniref:RRM domain-containing protein n=1 Tax=Collybia nuda TaxID=64659 RepID=A0A9P6CC08_9AGAR|nr:hypothetical protein BDZ94DRAFT_947042 [Collybia nuda]